MNNALVNNATPASQFHDGLTAPVDRPEWWTDRTEVAATLHMLHRAGIAVDVAEFMEKPWKWSNERFICRTLERFMADCGVTADRGWGMTMREVAEAGVK